jgi:hypothetical protein
MAFNIFFFASSLDSATGALKSFEVELMLNFEAWVGLVVDIVPILVPALSNYRSCQICIVDSRSKEIGVCASAYKSTMRAREKEGLK